MSETKTCPCGGVARRSKVVDPYYTHVWTCVICTREERVAERVAPATTRGDACACGGALDLTLREDTKHWAEIRCTGCRRFIGWSKRPSRMSSGEMVVALARLDRLLVAKGADTVTGLILSEMITRAARYRGTIPDAYRELLRASTYRAQGTGAAAVARALRLVVGRLDGAGGWPAGEPVATGGENDGAVMAKQRGLFGGGAA